MQGVAQIPNPKFMLHAWPDGQSEFCMQSPIAPVPQPVLADTHIEPVIMLAQHT
jgi:hypothetical protein